MNPLPQRTVTTTPQAARSQTLGRRVDSCIFRRLAPRINRKRAARAVSLKKEFLEKTPKTDDVSFDENEFSDSEIPYEVHSQSTSEEPSSESTSTEEVPQPTTTSDEPGFARKHLSRIASAIKDRTASFFKPALEEETVEGEDE